MDQSIRNVEAKAEPVLRSGEPGAITIVEGVEPCATAFSAETERLATEDESCDEGIG
jgi:hypothetical protein